MWKLITSIVIGGMLVGGAITYEGYTIVRHAISSGVLGNHVHSASNYVLPQPAGQAYSWRCKIVPGPYGGYEAQAVIRNDSSQPLTIVIPTVAIFDPDGNEMMSQHLWSASGDVIAPGSSLTYTGEAGTTFNTVETCRVETVG